MEEKEINLADVFAVLVTKWWVIVICLMVAAVAAFTASELFIAPQYTAKGSLYVSGSKMSTSEINYNQTQIAVHYAKTYADILKSNTVLTIVSEDMAGKYTPDELEKMISLQTAEETEILYVSVQATDPHDAYLIAQSLLKNAPGVLTEIVNGGDVKVIDEAQEPIEPSSPNVSKNTLIGGVAGFVIGIAIILLIEMFDTRIKNSDTIVEKYNIPVLGKIPQMNLGNAE